MKKISIIGLISFLFIFPAQAVFPETPEIISEAAVVMDAATGTIIYSKNPGREIPPASLTKLMTMHLVLNEIKAGKASLDEIFTPRRESWAINQPPGSSLMRIANGHRVSYRDLLLGMAIVSGNDAAAAAALSIAPSIEEFVDLMNIEAAAMGLTKTWFVDPAGYWEQNMTNALDFARFCRIYLEVHPESLLQFHSVKSFSYPQEKNLSQQYLNDTEGNSFASPAVRTNTNTLLGKVIGVDGFKTGYIPEAGYNIALTAERNSSRFIAVILGAPAEWGGDRIRDDDGRKLLEWAFANYKTIRPPVAAPESARVWKGKENYVELIFGMPLEFTALSERGENLGWNIELIEPLIAPLPAGFYAGDLVLYDSLGELRTIPILTANEIEKGGFFKRILDSIKLFFKQ